MSTSKPLVDNDPLIAQINQLATCILRYYPDEPGRTGESEGAVAVAVRLLTDRAMGKDTPWTHEHFCPQCGSTWSHAASACQAPIRVPCPRSVLHPEREQEVIRLEAIHRQRDRERYGY